MIKVKLTFKDFELLKTKKDKIFGNKFNYQIQYRANNIAGKYEGSNIVSNDLSKYDHKAILQIADLIIEKLNEINGEKNYVCNGTWNYLLIEKDNKPFLNFTFTKK